MDTITLGYTLAKPVVTQEECTAYAAMAQAVNDHNSACTDGDTRWMIEDGEDGYTVAAVPPPTAEELAAQEKARKEAEEKAQLPTAEERLAALEAAMLDLLAAQ
nr:MAG TPA: hypothetical protein [Caudoviricetes sp.]